MVAIVAVVGVAVTILAGFIRRVTTQLHDHQPPAAHQARDRHRATIQETRLERVQNVNYRQRLLQRILQIGDVDFDTAAGDDYNFIFVGVANPADVVQQVDQATHASHRRASATSPPRPTQGQGPQA